MSTATGLYEIKFVKEDSVFFSLGEFYIYDIQCELYVGTNEDIKTGIDEVDVIGNAAESAILLKLGEISGTFEVGEVAFQGPSSIGAIAKGTIIGFENANTLKLKDVFGEFDASYGPVKGKTAVAALYNFESTENITQDYTASNAQFDSSAVIDFTEHNPFSEEDF
jgi:hypothetical protein